MTTFHRGDVVLVPFDFTDGSGAKMRPAVIVSSDEYNGTSPDVLLASVTGNLDAIEHPGDHRVVDWKRAGLLRASLVQAKIATVESSCVHRRLGRLSTRDLRAVDQGLRQAMGL